MADAPGILKRKIRVAKHEKKKKLAFYGRKERMQNRINKMNQEKIDHERRVVALSKENKLLKRFDGVLYNIHWCI